MNKREAYVRASNALADESYIKPFCNSFPDYQDAVGEYIAELESKVKGDLEQQFKLAKYTLDVSINFDTDTGMLLENFRNFYATYQALEESKE